MISTVAPRLDNDSHALPALKRRLRIKPSLRDEEKIRATRKDVGNDKALFCRPHPRAERRDMRQVITFAFTGWTLVIGLLWPQAASVYLQIITVKTPESLDLALAQLQSGQDFADLARKHSTHSTAGDGGVWGPVRLNDLPEAVSAR